MVCVFLSFALGDDRVLKLFGLSLAAGVFLDAFVVRSLLLPAVLQLLGRTTWRLPDWLDRRLPHLAIDGQLADRRRATGTARPAFDEAGCAPASSPAGSLLGLAEGRDLLPLASESSRGSSPRATFSLSTWWRMSSTISGFASVLTSPTSAKLEIPAITRRMIFPERVFGMSLTTQTFFGRAIFPISVSIAFDTLSSISSLLGSRPA